MNKRSTGDVIFDSVNVLFMLLVIIAILPFITGHQRLHRDGKRVHPHRRRHPLPQVLQPEHLSVPVPEGSIGPAFLISFLRLIIGVPISMLLTIILAYAMTKKTMPTAGAHGFLVFMMYFDGGLVPNLILMRTSTCITLLDV